MANYNKHFMVITCTAFVGASCAFGAPECALEGTVLNAATNTPIAAIMLTIRNAVSAARTTASDTAGHFCFTDLQPGSYQLRANGKGYVAGASSTTASPTASERTVSIGADHHGARTTIHLWPEGTLHGTVVDQEQQAVTGADVRLLMLMTFDGRRQLMPVWTGSTDANGVFDAVDLSPGTYYASAFSPGSARKPAQTSGDTVPVLTFFPSAYVPELAVPIEVRPGSQLDLGRIVLQSIRAVSVKGRVVTAGREDAGGAVVSLCSNGLLPIMGRSEKSVVAGPEGSFVLEGVPPGDYRIKAIIRKGSAVLAGEVNLSVGNRSIDTVQVRLAQSAPVKGVVQIASDNDRHLGKVYVSLVSRHAGEMAAAAKVDADGSFLLSDVPPGTYDIRVAGFRDHLYVKAILSGTADIGRNGLTLAGVSPELIQIVLSDRGAKVAGRLTNAANEATIGIIVLIPEDNNTTGGSSLWKSVSTDQFGNFVVQGVRPGVYVVAGSDQAGRALTESPEGLQLAKDKGTRLRLEEQAQLSLQVTAVP